MMAMKNIAKALLQFVLNKEIKMRNSKELKLLLISIYCLNHMGNKDKNIDKILEYTFNRVFNSNTNLLLLACLNKSHADILKEINHLLKENTKLDLLNE